MFLTGRKLTLHQKLGILFENGNICRSYQRKLLMFVEEQENKLIEGNEWPTEFS